MKLLIPSRGPNLTASSNFLLPMLLDLILHQILEINHTILSVRMQRSIDKHSRVKVLLHAIHEFVIFQLDAFEKVGRALEYVIPRDRVAEYLILGGHCRSTGWKHTHDEKIRRGEIDGRVWENIGEGPASKEVDVFWLDVVSVRREVIESARVRLNRVTI